MGLLKPPNIAPTLEMMMQKLYPYRFKIFLSSQISILFGSLVVPSHLYEHLVSPILFQINILAGILLLSKIPRKMWFAILLLIFTLLVLGSDITRGRESFVLVYLKIISFFTFYLTVTYELISQVWKSNVVSKNVIFGLISGYISLGLLGFFVCLTIEIAYPNSYGGFLPEVTTMENLMYFSYVTLLSMGFWGYTTAHIPGAKVCDSDRASWSDLRGSNYSYCCWQIHQPNKTSGRSKTKIEL